MTKKIFEKSVQQLARTSVKKAVLIAVLLELEKKRWNNMNNIQEIFPFLRIFFSILYDENNIKIKIQKTVIGSRRVVGEVSWFDCRRREFLNVVGHSEIFR